jgi:hypothetical protein
MINCQPVGFAYNGLDNFVKGNGFRKGDVISDLLEIKYAEF